MQLRKVGGGTFYFHLRLMADTGVGINFLSYIMILYAHGKFDIYSIFYFFSKGSNVRQHVVLGDVIDVATNFLSRN